MAYGVGDKKRDQETLKKKAAASEKAAWLKKTRNSPAAKAGFSDDERWALQQKHRKWKADRSKPKAKAKPQSKAKVDPVTKKKTNKVTEVTSKDTKTTAFMKRGGGLGWLNRKRKRLGDKLKVATSAFKKG